MGIQIFQDSYFSNVLYRCPLNCRIGHRIGQAWPIRWPIYKFQKNKRKIPDFARNQEFFGGDYWTRTSDLLRVKMRRGRHSPAIGCFPVLLPPVSAGTNHYLVHCVHPLIFWYWSAYWSKPQLRRIRRNWGFFSKTNLVAVIVTWARTIVKYLFQTQATCSVPPPPHQMVGKYMKKTNGNK